jgi:hypothetical protein
MDEEQQIEESTDVVEQPEDSPAPQENQAQVILSLEELIKNNIANIDKLRNDVKQHQEMYNDSFENDPTYRENAEKVKEANKVKSTTRENIAKQPSVIQLVQKVKDMRVELKERQAALSDYLLEYQRLTGVNEIEGHDGIVRDIINSSKAIKRSSKDRG